MAVADAQPVEVGFICDMPVNPVHQVVEKYDILDLPDFRRGLQLGTATSRSLSVEQLQTLIAQPIDVTSPAPIPITLGDGRSRLAVPRMRDQVFDEDRRWTTLTAPNGLEPQCRRSDQRLVVGVQFLGSSSAFQRERVILYASAWNLVSDRYVLYFKDDVCNMHNIRIAFGGSVNDSDIGADPSRAYGLPTMHLAAVREGNDEEAIRQAVQHEFGHALGLYHELQHPNRRDYHWTEAFFAYFRARGWDDTRVREEIIRPIELVHVCSAYDPTSIMHYPLMREWTVEGVTVTVGSIAPGDRECVRRMYAR